ncbi:DUF1800 family protein [Akkermansiaceae bacterium]|nr:DUF1800 family protein [Akkermansiaceae bacterium]MDB4537609.1 DUF1800 family protein [Akkermansiaceae bacterium]
MSVSALAVDLNSDGLSDIWQQKFGAQSLVAASDDDGDGFSNGDESVAGTDPFNAADFPQQSAITMGPSGNPMMLEFPTKAGKWYQLSQSRNLQNFVPVGPLLSGTGQVMQLQVDMENASKRGAQIDHELWANVAGNDLSALIGMVSYPGNPDGVASLDRFEIPKSLASGFGGRLQVLISPPSTGDYQFYVSSAGESELSLSAGAGEEGLEVIARVTSAQTDVAENDWLKYPGQASDPVSLTAGEPYLMELRYLASVSRAHCQIAWTGPGVAEPQLIPPGAIVPVDFLPQEMPLLPLMSHDYDLASQTGVLWNSGTSLVSGITGMTGNAERVDSDPTGGDDLVTFPAATTENFYTSFLFNMTFSHDEVNLYFRNADTSSQDGPRIDLEESGPDYVEGEPFDPAVHLAVIRVGGLSGDNQINVTYGDTYRMEIVASLQSGGFPYQAGLASYLVAEDTYDVYVSDLDGNLIGSVRGMTFQDASSGIEVEKIDAVRIPYVSNPNIVFDEWEFTGGNISGNGYLRANTEGFTPDEERHFFRMKITDSDQDGDGLMDWEELALAKNLPYLFFDATTVPGQPDGAEAAALLGSLGETIEVTLAASDTAAFERNSPNSNEDYGEVILTRTGPLTPLEVQLCVQPLSETGNTETVCDGTCCTLIGSAGDEVAEVEDYEITDADGNVIVNSVTFEFGEMSKVLRVRAIPDAIVEYPETLNLAIEPAESDTYQVSTTTNGASIQLFDLPDSPENQAIFTGAFGPENGVPTGGSGFTTATLNGPRTQLLLYTEFSGLSSAQQDSHIHKSNQIPGNPPSSGSIIYEITQTPGDVESDPLNGPLTAYPWDLTDSSGATPTGGGAASKQTIIDSLFGQNGESPLYLNIHTADYPGGEIWSFLILSGGSQVSPGVPTPDVAPGSAGYPQLAGDELESEVRRFLNQATFGAIDAEVAAMVASIENERLSDPSYHRAAAYDDWIESQIGLQQSYHLDYALAADFQHYKIGGMYDPARNPSNVDYTTPTLPAVWPTVDRSSANPEHWHLDLAYPVNWDDARLADDNGLRAEPGGASQRHVLWQMMINARDQLRQKMGFSLQQIVVASYSSGTLDDQPYGMANYQDMLNTHAFGHYRDVLGYVNWSPIMGRWLSSLQNQKAADLNGDGEDDIYPDENLARENMQLFSIGLFELWPDGTLRLGPNGLPVPTYTNDDIREFAKILTGQSFGRYNSISAPWGGTPYASMEVNDVFDRGQTTDGLLSMRYSYPMIMFGDFHDTSAKTFAGVTIDNTDIVDPNLQGVADIEDALDWLAGKPDGQPDYEMINSHRSTPAFICKRLIQRFTTSNPSREYLHRVATVFKDQEGDLKATIKAILLDSEARKVDLTNTTFGLKKSPLEGYLQILRSLEAFTYIPMTDPAGAAPFDGAPGSFSNPDLYLGNFNYPASQMANQERNFRFLQANTFSAGSAGLQMIPMTQETVFNWYLSDYSPGGAISGAGLVSPELQLANEQDIIRNINYFEDITRQNSGTSGDSLAGSTDNQRLALGVADSSADSNDRVRLDRSQLSIALYPTTAPTPVGGRDSESLADEILVDELDRRLTLGYLKRKYPYDPSDDEDPAGPAGNDFFKNPRELIIDALSIYGNPFGGTNDDIDRLNKLSDALYLLTMSPEFQIKK